MKKFNAHDVLLKKMNVTDRKNPYVTKEEYIKFVKGFSKNFSDKELEAVYKRLDPKESNRIY